MHVDWRFRVERRAVVASSADALRCAGDPLCACAARRCQRLCGRPCPKAQKMEPWRKAPDCEDPTVYVLLTVPKIGFEAPSGLSTFVYWMTSSARTSNDCGMVRPSAFDVFKLMTNSNLVGCSTGKSAGFAPFRILSMYPAAMT